MKETKYPKCPFCGGIAKKEQTRGSFGGYGLKRVYCQSCSASASEVDWAKRNGYNGR